MLSSSDIGLKWDHRFIAMCQLVASWSKDPKRQVGAVIVRPDKTVASVGYNGFPRGMGDADDRLYDKPQKYMRTVHAEMNAVLSAYEPVRGYILYTWPYPPCTMCAPSLIQTGISAVVTEGVPTDVSQADAKDFEIADSMFAECNVTRVWV